MSFQGKVVIVTGAGKGIGKCIAETYASEGATVVIAEKDPELGNNTEKEIKAKGEKAEFVRADVSRPGDIINLIQKVAEKYLSIDILINNAGISSHESPYD
ncbi:MAG: SDR family NAD(P)-dependent oxidoreductase, partial [Chloroflexota bacterium]